MEELKVVGSTEVVDGTPEAKGDTNGTDTKVSTI